MKLAEMKSGQLREILRKATDKYLAENPEKTNFFSQSIHLIYSGMSEDGRQAAKNFKEEVLRDADDYCNEIVILHSVLSRIFKEDNILNKSKAYRYHLLLGVCEYLGADTKEIDEVVNKKIQNEANFIAKKISYNFNDLRLKILKNIYESEIKPKINILNQPAETKKSSYKSIAQ